MLALPYFYEPSIQKNNTHFELSEVTSKHCIQVLRMRAGESLHLTDGIGNLYDGFLRDDVEISTENEEAKITIHGGTRLLNSDTNNLNGKLNISLFYYNLDYDQSFESFSGGIIGTIEENNSIENSLFYKCI